MELLDNSRGSVTLVERKFRVTVEAHVEGLVLEEVRQVCGCQGGGQRRHPRRLREADSGSDTNMYSDLN